MLTAEEKPGFRCPDYRDRLASLRLIDDEFMTVCFGGDTACVELVLRIVLDEPGLVVKEVRTQAEYKNLLGRSVRMDVVATGGDGRAMNVEIQRTNSGAGSRRARYHSSALDASLLDKGAGFEQLPDSYVIFITEHDVLGRGQPVYKVERCVMDNGELFGDGAHILYVNGAYRGETPVGWLMHDFFCTKAEDMHYAVLAERAGYFKEDEEGRSKMSRIMEEIFKEERKEIAQQMLADGVLPLEEISKYLRLSLEEVQRLSLEQPQ